LFLRNKKGAMRGAADEIPGRHTRCGDPIWSGK
jgi:hypothetical protein